VGPAQYFACFQTNGTTDTARMLVTSVTDFTLTKGQTSGTFGAVAVPQQVLQYLARYTPPSCHFNGRLLSLENGRVRLRWRDSRDHNQIKEMTLEAVEFIRRFLLHGAGYSASPGKFEVLDALAG
jgi:hypothetical protein